MAPPSKPYAPGKKEPIADVNAGEATPSSHGGIQLYPVDPRNLFDTGNRFDVLQGIDLESSDTSSHSPVSVRSVTSSATLVNTPSYYEAPTVATSATPFSAQAAGPSQSGLHDHDIYQASQASDRRMSIGSMNYYLSTLPLPNRHPVQAHPIQAFDIYEAQLTRPRVRYPHISAGAQVMNGISEMLVVEEYGFRQGQQDRGIARDRTPENLFGRAYDEVWIRSYHEGKMSTASASNQPSNKPPSAGNYTWAPLINPYTQSKERPNGDLDRDWVRAMCTQALDAMQALIHVACKRVSGWNRTVCEVPLAVQDALIEFPDLSERYQQLRRDAREAVAGGQPVGYF